ncbi:MAG: heavy metal-associated domain-containing protein [bacterium]
MKKNLLIFSILSLLILGITLGAYVYKIGPFKEKIASTKFIIKGINCQSCEHKIKNELSKQKGFKSCSIDTKTGVTTLTYIEEPNRKEELLQTIKTLGFTTKGVSKLRLDSYKIEFK